MDDKALALLVAYNLRQEALQSGTTIKVDLWIEPTTKKKLLTKASKKQVDTVLLVSNGKTHRYKMEEILNGH